MQLEYCYYDTSSNEIELKENILQAIKYGVDSISVFPSYLKVAKGCIPEHIKLSCPIDYPLGILDLKSRLSASESAIKNGAKIIELVCPTYLLSNKKYDKFREDIREHLKLCNDNNIELRYVLEYRVYTYESLYKIAQILVTQGISTIYPSTGYSLDDINDNILATVLINKKVSKINIVCNGNIWQKNHIELLKKTNLYGIRVNSLNALDLLTKN
jgi:deoxyribose-phosphate aldolase